jgi:hypothetical protein
MLILKLDLCSSKTLHRVTYSLGVTFFFSQTTFYHVCSI